MAEDSNDPAIYSVVNALRPGSPGPASVIERPPPCPACGLPFRDQVIELDLLLDDWIPCDFIVVDDTYAVTPRLRSALLALDPKGVAFRPMAVGQSEIFAMNDPEGEVALPELVELSVIAEIDGPSGWWVREGHLCALRQADLGRRGGCGRGPCKLEAASQGPAAANKPRCVAWRGHVLDGRSRACAHHGKSEGRPGEA